MERTDVFLELDLNEHSVLAALLIDRKDFCGDGSHLWRFLTSDFAGDGNRPQRVSGTDRHHSRRESSEHSRLSPANASFIPESGNPMNFYASE